MTRSLKVPASPPCSRNICKPSVTTSICTSITTRSAAVRSAPAQRWRQPSADQETGATNQLRLRETSNTARHHRLSKIQYVRGPCELRLDGLRGDELSCSCRCHYFRSSGQWWGRPKDDRADLLLPVRSSHAFERYL